MDDIQRDIERTRRQLAGTLDELADRSKPKNIADDAKRSANARLQDPNVQKVLIGIGVAVAGIIALSVARSNKKSRDIKEIQRLLAQRTDI